MSTFTAPPAVQDFVIRSNTFSNKIIEIVDLSRKYMSLPQEIESNIKYKYEKYYSPYFRIFVDLKENQPENAFIGYCMICGIINRSIKIKLDYALLFPLNQRSGETVNYQQLDHLKETSELLLLQPYNYYCYNMSDINEKKDLHLFSIKKYNTIENKSLGLIKDDYGKIFSNFSNIRTLSIVDTPNKLLNKEYILTDMERFAPMTSEDTYCVLYVEKVNTIKVLRWIPQKKEIERNKNRYIGHHPLYYPYVKKVREWGDYFFELGYLQYDYALYEFMVENNSKLMFATKHLNSIKLLGGLDIFLKNRFYYPKCISKIPVK